MRRAMEIGVVMAMLATPAMAVWVEDFSYPDGSLAGNVNPYGDTWEEWGGVAGINVSGGSLHLSSGTEDTWCWNTGPNESGSVVTVTVNVMKGTVGPDGEGNFWYLYLGDQTNTYNIGYWYGGATYAQSRMGNSVVRNDLIGSGWNQLKAEVDFGVHQTRFYFNGVLNHTINHSGSPTAVGLVEINRYPRTPPDEIPGCDVYFDDIVIPEPTAAILLTIAGLLFLRPRR